MGKKEAVGGLILRLRSAGITGHALLAAFEEVPRQNFVPILHLQDSYARSQMPIECGQFMEPPDHVGKVLAALVVTDRHRVLELGTGSGYQTALLGKLAARVTSIERFKTLVEKAETRLKNLGIDNVTLKHADGFVGDRQDGVYDRIITSCAFDTAPRHLIDQMSPQGILVAPIGPPEGEQVVKKMTRVGSRFDSEDLFKVRFQPFTSGVSLAI